MMATWIPRCRMVQRRASKSVACQSRGKSNDHQTEQSARLTPLTAATRRAVSRTVAAPLSPLHAPTLTRSEANFPRNAVPLPSESARSIAMLVLSDFDLPPMTIG
jgi:hypothetical protein